MYKNIVYLSMDKKHDTNGESAMAMSRLYEVTVAVKVVVHAFDSAEAERLASQNLENMGWAVRSAKTVIRRVV